MLKPGSKLNIKVFIVFALVVTISLCLLASMSEHVSGTKTASCATASIASFSIISASEFISNDTNWAGYIVASDLQNPQSSVTSVTASWTVPAVNISQNDTFSAVWIGIGGFFDSTLIQTGTEQDSIQGQSEYSAWIEFLPQNSITIDSITVSPGDQINATIQLTDANTDQWSIYLKDITKNQEYTGSFFYVSSQLTAEWIVERPDISSQRSRGTLTSLADIGTVEFANCQTTISGETGTISTFPTVQSIMYATVQSTTTLGSTLLATVSNPTDNGSSFTVETSPSVVPELPPLMLLLLITGICLLAIIKRKCFRFCQINLQKML